VTVGNNFYSPASLTVPANTTVTWAWASGAATHTVTFDNGGPTSPQQSSGTFEHAFGTPGTYTYFCQIHGANVMHGTIVVTGAGSGSGGGGLGGGGTGGGGGGLGGGGPGGGRGCGLLNVPEQADHRLLLLAESGAAALGRATVLQRLV
jgi:hypothetical protein